MYNVHVIIVYVISAFFNDKNFDNLYKKPNQLNMFSTCNTFVLSSIVIFNNCKIYKKNFVNTVSFKRIFL